MLSIFPELFAYQHLGPFVLRIALALVLLKYAYSEIFKSSDTLKKISGTLKAVSGLALLIGFLTQVTAIIVILIFLTEKLKLKMENQRISNHALKFLIVSMSIALLLLGPGFLSVDLPL